MLNLFTLGFKVSSEGFDQLQGNIDGITNAVGALGAAFTSLKGVQLGKELVKEFADAQTESMRLQAAIQGVGLNYASLKPKIDETIDSMMRLTTIEDDAASGALARLVATTRDMDKSLRGLRIAQEFAARGMMDLEGAAVLVGKAINGNTTMLKKFGIDVNETGDVLAQLETAFVGVAEAQARTLGGAMEQSTVQIGNFREAIGETLATTFNLDAALRTLTGVFRDASGEYSPLATSIAVSVGTVGTLTVAVYGLAAAFVALRAALAGAGATGVLASLTNPYVLAALATLTAALALYANSSAKAAKASEEFRLSLDKKSAAVLQQEKTALEGEIAALEKRRADSMKRYGAANVGGLDDARKRLGMYTQAIENAAAREAAAKTTAEIEARRIAAEQAARLEAMKKAEEDAFDTRTRLAGMTNLTAQSIKNLADEAARYEAIAAQTNTTEKRRLELLERANQIREMLAQQTTTEVVTLGKTSAVRQVQAGFTADTGLFKEGGAAKPFDGGLGTGRERFMEQAEAFKLDINTIVAEIQTHSIMKFIEMKENLRKNLEAAFADGLGQSVYDAFASAFSGEGIGGLFENFGRSVLKGLGKIFVMMGQYMIGASGIFQAIAAALVNPLTSGFALAAYGAALIALGAGMGAIATRGENKSVAGAAATGGVGGGGGYESMSQRLLFGASTGSVAAGMTPRESMNITVIGKDDPRAQRELLELFDNAQRRGSL